MESELMKREWIRTIRQPGITAAVAGPTVRVERLVAVVLEDIAMEVAGAALGDESDLTGG